MSEADHKRPRRRAAGWLLAGILLLALCGAMAAFQASTAGSAARMSWMNSIEPGQSMKV